MHTAPMPYWSSWTRAILVAASLTSVASCGGLDQQQPGRRDASADRVLGPDAPVVPEVDVADVAGADDVPMDTGTETAMDASTDSAAMEAAAPIDGPVSDADTLLDGGDIDVGGIDAAPRPASIVVLPDTQYYSAGVHPEAYGQQTSWILLQRRALNINAVLHVGDLVDTFDSAAQWTVASKAMHVLDGNIPYVVVPGNHDTDGDRNTPINAYFSAPSMRWITGTMAAGRIENSYALISIGPEQWLVVGLEFGPRDSVVAWADGILKAYPEHPAMLLTHAYLYRDGTRYDSRLPAEAHQSFLPQDYGYTASEGINDGEMLWQKLVLPNPNVRLVFSGHDTGGARLTSTRPDGSRVYQMLSDYQWLGGANFGFGYLRLVTFDYHNRTIAVRTYSPYLGQYLADGENQFTLDMNF